MIYVFQSGPFVQDILVFLMGILAGFVTASMVQAPRWIVDELTK